MKRPRSSDDYSYLSKRQKPNESSEDNRPGDASPGPSKGENPAIHDEAMTEIDFHLESQPADKPTETSSLKSKVPSANPNQSANGDAGKNALYGSPAVNEELAAPSQNVAAPIPADSLVSPPTSLLDDMDGIVNHGHAKQVLSVNGGHDKEHPVEVNTPASTSPKLPHPTIPETTAASRESELNKVHASDTVEQQPIPSPAAAPSPKPTKPSSRPSSSHKTKQSMTTTKEPKHTHTSVENKGSPSRGQHDASPTSPQRPSKQGKRERDRVSFPEVDADAESLKLIKEIQEQEFGLRRRTTRS